MFRYLWTMFKISSLDDVLYGTYVSQLYFTIFIRVYGAVYVVYELQRDLGNLF